MHLLAERLVFSLGVDQGFVKERAKTYQMSLMLPLNWPTFFLSSLSLSMSYCWKEHNGLNFPRRGNI
jgi:hypothetical protein